MSEVETRTTHYYEFYGRTLTGYGPSMDPHRCGDPDEPCLVITEERTVSPWRVVSEKRTPPIDHDCTYDTPGAGACAVCLADSTRQQINALVPLSEDVRAALSQTDGANP